MKTLTIFNAIIHVGNSIISAITQTPLNNNNDTAGKALEELKKLLLPGETERLERKTEKIKRQLKEEAAKGPIRVQAVDDGRKKKGRGRRR